ncbi:SusC/RagA family TonB-linked outer membrane protein [Parapedobacter indicus]|uniref:TonB-linked outer membrane protein, SusC/RagA family n=1 Tax=Parapedobacter indicus TaxID=1477437 RepID=A0A1I3TGF1_9SPHI|nr:SusC/RagA family TonB-linked outer membrane protein [Parapedobacter indicus]PPK99509.1 TonB-linked SusC/RagA family outer membrane protein [Parapedobacter indicus]SFJ69583.1 TonB-linked outer membrane protein, SusC/RagA family [Parapedobacter indicus]
MKLFILTVLICCTISTSKVWGQTTKLTGRVVNDADGKPLVGALVRSSNGNSPTKTDESGMFVLTISPKDTVLYVSFLGYETSEINLRTPYAKPLTVMLQPGVRALEEVIVSTGYEEIPLERATGSFEKIDNALLNRSVGMDVLSRIENIASGVYFNNRKVDINSVGPPDHDLYVRGISTLRNAQVGATAPLIVLDNFPYEGSIANINPNDIESVTILKDAAASSIWGAKAGNGVVVITTKKADFSQPTRVSFNHSVNVTAKPDLYARKVMEASDIIDMEMFLFDKGFYNSNETKRSKPALSPIVELLIQLRDGKMDTTNAYNAIDQYRANDIREDMLDYIYRQSVNRQYALSMDGGNAYHRFRLFGGYDKMLNSQRGSENDRINVKLENSFNIGTKLLLDSRIFWTQTRNTYASLGTTGANYGSNGYPYPYIRFADDDGQPLPVPNDYRMGFLDTAGQGKLLDWQYRPLDEIRNPANHVLTREILMNVGLTYKIAQWANAELKYQYGNENGIHQNHGSLENYATRDLINRYTQIDANGVVSYAVPLGGILRLTNTAASSHRLRGQANINKDWTDRHRLRGLLGMDVQQRKTTSNAYDTYGYDDEYLTFVTNIDHNTRYPIYANLAAASFIPNTRAFAGSVNRFVSVYGNLAYTFLDKYTITGSARKDASNLFGVSTNNKWTPLWSLGVNWNLAKESFIPDGWFDRLNIRFSTGYSGNVDNSMSALTTISYTTVNSVWGIDWPAAQIANLPNRELRWEKVSTHNLGLDFSIWNRRVSGSIDLYKKNTFDLLSPFPVDPSTGRSLLIMNVARTESRGLDLQLHTQNTVGKLKWSTDLVFAYNNNWIRETFEDELNPVSYTNLGSLIVYKGAMAYGAYSYQWAGLNPENGQPMGYLNGEASADYRQIASRENTRLTDLVLHGSARPLYFGSLRNTVTFRNVSISFNLTGKFSYYFRREGLDYGSLIELNNGHADYYRRWQHPGDELHTNVPAFVYPTDSRANSFYRNSEVLVERGDHIRLQDIRIAYRLDPVRAGQTVLLKNAEVFLFGNNVGFVWRANRLGLDPDVADGIPLPRSIAAGINLSF